MVKIDEAPVRHRVDVYHTPITVLYNAIAPAYTAVNFTLPIGIILRARIQFKRGCNHKVSLQIFQGTVQWLPFDAGDVFVGEALEYDLPIYHNVYTGNQAFYLKGWNDGACYCNHTIDTYFTVQRAEII